MPAVTSGTFVLRYDMGVASFVGMFVDKRAGDKSM